MTFAPTVGEIRTQVRQKLRLDPADDTMVLYWMNQAYADVAQYASFSVAETVISVASAASAITLPAGVEMVRQVQRRYTNAPDSRPAQKVRVEEVLSRLNADSTPNSPSDNGGIYSLSGEVPNQIVIWPVAAAGEKIVVIHSVLPPKLTADTDTLLISEPFGSKIVEYGALVEGSKFKKDPLIYDFENTLALWMDRYIGWLNRRKTANSTAFEIWGGEQEVDRLEAESEH